MPLLTATFLALALNAGPMAAITATPLPMPPVAAFTVDGPPAISATAWMAWSVPAGGAIGAFNPDRQVAPASITKTMTAILVVEHADLGTPVTVTATAAGTPLGYIGQPALRQGEVWLVIQLLEFMMVQSGNDAAAALAEHVSGSTASFVDLMNRRAAELGMTSTTFRTPHGLDAEGQLSTARDLIVLGLASLDYPTVRDVNRIREVSFDLGSRMVTITQTNRDIGVYPGYLGIKTGDTALAGQTLLSYTQTARGGVVAVVLGSDDRRQATRDLVAWATRALGPRDHLLSAASVSQAGDGLPDWYHTRLETAGHPLPTGDPVPNRRSPLIEDLDDRLRELLPVVLGGSP